MSLAPYHLGFTTLEKEVAIAQLPVAGEVPSWLTGTLLRTGPAKFEVGKQAYNHWFDGLAMLHKFAFSQGKVAYVNKYLASQSYQEAMEQGEISRSEFGTEPRLSLWERLLSLFNSSSTDNGNVSITKLANCYVAVTETPLPTVITPDTLEGKGRFSYQGEIAGQLTTAHPHFDFERQLLYNYQTKLGRNCSYEIYSMAAGSAKRQLLCSIPVEKPAYMHSFAMSENYLILAQFPFFINPIGLATSSLRNKSLMSNFYWQAEAGTNFLIISKETGQVVNTCTSEDCFSFHHINAFEQEGQIVLDMVIYPDDAIVRDFYLANLRRGNKLAQGIPHRYFLPLEEKEVKHHSLSPTNLQLPRINYPPCNGKTYRYVYGAGTHLPNNFNDQLVKLDVETREVKYWREAGCYPGEPVFVPAPEAREEDEGVVLSVILDVEQSNSFLLVLDAASWQEKAKVRVPHHIPFGFHGQYFATTEASPQGDFIHR